MSTVKNIWYWPLVGVAGGVLFGVIDATVDIYFFYPDETLIHTLFSPTSLEIWLRSFVLFLMVLFGVYVSFSMNRIVRVRNELQNKEELLKEEVLAKEELANRDPLTGIYNRRKLFTYLKEHMEEARRYDFPLTVLMLDLDFFKKVNDTYGHNEGDQILSKFCQLVSKQIRKSDLFARFGGEEFAIAAVYTTPVQAQALAEKVRKTVEKRLSTHGLGVTVSIGVAEFQKDDTMDDLFHRADESLYAAKNNGRNCVGPVSEVGEIVPAR